jgi:ATP-dependent Clp protease ATP-binding subunit ClpA
MMMTCSRCKKRPATVFISTISGSEKKNEGLCIKCAKELGIPQIDQYMETLGITDDELDKLDSYVDEFLDGENFEMGGANTTLPPFIQNLLKNSKSNKEDNKNGNSDTNKFPTSDMINDEFYEASKRMEDMLSQKEDFTPKGNANKKRNPIGKKKEKKLKFLDGYCTNLSKKAENGELDAVIGRDREIYRVIQILSRRTKNNPCLIGEPGVGKTAVAEGIAQKIYDGEVPFTLRDKKIYLMDLTALVAGTQFRGQFESRIKGLVDEVKAEGNIILFIDEVHSLVGTGDAEGTMNAANILKPALSRGEVQVIGATTFNEYRKYIEKDSALERRFQPVTVEEPTIDETVEILKGIKGYYEKYHKVHITDELIRMCAVLSERYITDRFLPDKAIDLLDESCACKSISSPELTEYVDKTKELETLNELKKSLDDSEDLDFEAIAKVKSDIIRCQEEVKSLEESTKNIYVEAEDLAKVIELWTGIPANKIAEAEFKRISDLENQLKKRIIGQDEAVELVAKAIKRTRVQLSKRKRPASFIFVGPTGVGKTELVKVLADEMFDSAEPLIKLNMTEFMEKHSVSRIIGSPPGYVGYDEAGQLTEKIRRKPYSVVLFDEIEKAHPDVMNILLQILDEGKITDAQGRTVNFEHTIIAMTSNAGSTDKSVGVGFNKTESDISKEKAIKGLREFLRPEFLSRIDEVVVFNQLEKPSYEKIAKLMLDEMVEPLQERELTLTYTDEVLSIIADKSFSNKHGARDIRKVIRTNVEDKIAELVIDNSTNHTNTTISVTAKDGEIVVELV